MCLHAFVHRRLPHSADGCLPTPPRRSSCCARRTSMRSQRRVPHTCSLLLPRHNSTGCCATLRLHAPNMPPLPAPMRRIPPSPRHAPMRRHAARHGSRAAAAFRMNLCESGPPYARGRPAVTGERTSGCSRCASRGAEQGGSNRRSVHGQLEGAPHRRNLAWITVHSDCTAPAAFLAAAEQHH